MEKQNSNSKYVHEVEENDLSTPNECVFCTNLVPDFHYPKPNFNPVEDGHTPIRLLDRSSPEFLRIT